MKSFLSGRPQHVPPATPAEPTSRGSGLACLHPARSPAAEGAAPAAGPRVECIKQGDKVVRLIVICGCGERIEVDCLYENLGG